MKKIISISITVIIIICSIVPLSFAFSPTMINTPLSKPSEIDTHAYILLQNQVSQSYLIDIDSKGLFDPQFCTFIARQYNEGIRTSYKIPYSSSWYNGNFTVTSYDLITGTLINSKTYNFTNVSGTNYFIDFQTILPTINDTSGNIVLENISWGYFNQYNAGYFDNNNTGCVKLTDTFVHWKPVYNPIHSGLPMPMATPRRIHFASSKFLYVIYIRAIAVNSIDLTNNNGSSNYPDFDLTIAFSNNQVQWSIVNQSSESFNRIYLITYDLISGDFIRSDDLGSVPKGSIAGNIIVDDFSNGYWIDQTNCYCTPNDVPLLSIAWSDTIDYHDDFNVLSELLTESNDYLEQIEHYTHNTSTATGQLNFAFNQFYGWYLHTFSVDIQDKLDTIIELLQGDGEQETLPVDSQMQSDVSNYVQDEHEIISQFGEAEYDVDVAFNNINQSFSEFGNSFWIVRDILQAYLDFPLVTTLILFSLTFGLVILIIGKKVGG